MTNFISRWFTKKPDEPVRDIVALTAPLGVPAIHIVKTESPSLSHFGGSPQLAEAMSWPVHKGKPLSFLARLSLPEIHRASPIDWLPRTGALLFFYDIDEQPWGFDPKDRGSSVVLLARELPAPVAQPEAPPEGGPSPVPHRNVAFRRVDVFPSWERDAVRDLQLSDKESDLLADLTDKVFQEEPKHQLAGFPAPVQGDGMELECQLATHGLYCGDPAAYDDQRAKVLEPGARDWRLLFQVDSDDAIGVMWGDAGVIYYWVQEHAAREGRFENTWLILQCH